MERELKFAKKNLFNQLKNLKRNFCLVGKHYILGDQVNKTEEERDRAEITEKVPENIVR